MGGDEFVWPPPFSAHSFQFRFRKQIANELGYECPEIVQPDMEDDEKRALARALNLARRHLILSRSDG